MLHKVWNENEIFEKNIVSDALLNIQLLKMIYVFMRDSQLKKSDGIYKVDNPIIPSACSRQREFNFNSNSILVERNSSPESNARYVNYRTTTGSTLSVFDHRAISHRRTIR